MSWSILLLIVIPLLVGIATVFLQSRRRSRLIHRPDVTILWQRRFRDASEDDVREFLALFAETFGFAPMRSQVFSPDDRLMEIYSTLYPWYAVGDSMELERLMIAFKRRYGVTLPSSDMTLGELFDLRRPERAESHSRRQGD